MQGLAQEVMCDGGMYGWVSAAGGCVGGLE